MLKRIISATWFIGGMPVLGIMSQELPPVHPDMLAGLFIWAAGTIPAIGVLCDD